MHGKKRKGQNNKRLIKTARWLASLFILLLLYFLVETEELELVSSENPPVFYANQCHDNLEKMYVNAIDGAESSILLIIYSLSDKELINALNRKSAEGVKIKVIHDSKTPRYGFEKLCSKIDKEAVKISGLMHQKILVIDRQKVWLGSANMTTESLKVHDNLVVGLCDERLAQMILSNTPFDEHLLENQKIEYWSFPQKGKEGLQRLIELIDRAESSVRVAMFTWTHPDLSQAVIRAKNRGIQVQIVLDRDQAAAVSQKALEILQSAKIDVRLSNGPGLLHHKFAWIDEKTLINGSANWTKSAFTRNWDCFIILTPLNETQNQKMRELWRRTIALSKSQPLKEAA